MEIPFPAAAALTSTTPWQTSTYFGGSFPALTIGGDGSFTAPGAFASLWHNVVCGPDVDLSAQMGTGVSGDHFELTARLTSIGATFNGYAVKYVWSTGVLTLLRYVGAASTTLGTATVNLGSGDSIGIRCIQDSIFAYTKSGSGPWTKSISATDSTLKPGGYAALYSDRSGGVLRNVVYGDLNPVVNDPYGRVVLKSNPYVFLRFEDASGTTTGKMIDWSGNGNGFTAATNAAFSSSASPIWKSPGRAMTSTSGSMSGAYDTSTPMSQVFSAECWMKHTNASDWPNLINRGWVGDGWLLYADGAGRILFGVAKGGAQYNIAGTVPSGTYADTRWHHVAATFDGQNSKVYVDGVLTGSGSAPDNGYNTQASGTWSINGPNVGTETLAEVAIYNRVLTPDEILTHYNAGKPYYGMVI